MLFGILSIIASAIVLPKLSAASPVVARSSDTLPVYKNANHIFNAVHSSMRQWGSSLNHNGMSFFPAYMPAGTELYHGTGTPDPVKVMEWLAFEPEHALNFAWTLPQGFLDKPPANNSGDQYNLSTKWVLGSNLTGILMQQKLGTGQDDFYQQFHDSVQRPLHHGGGPPPIKLQSGWLHTYVMKRDLRLIYVDGQSAAKSVKGTLDSQDFVLGPGTESDRIWPDRWRALRMCRIAAEEWNGRIDGFIRMEHGFELILCDFETNADLTRVERANGSVFWAYDDNVTRNFSFLKAIAARYHGIGMGRILLDYSRMVTAFAYDIGLFSDQIELPRLKNVSRDDCARIFADLSKSVVHDDFKPSSQWTDWQAIADMIMARYSDALHELAYSPSYKSKRRIEIEIALLMRPFIDYDRRNTSLEIQRCTSHFIPSNYTSSIASTAVFEISRKICSTFFMAAKLQSFDDARQIFQSLVEYLQWTSWKECIGCRYDEICFTAIWPFGNEEDHTHPSCKKAMEIPGRWHYWLGN